MRFLKIKVLLKALGVLVAWQFVADGYVLYLTVASENLLAILGSECSLHLQDHRDVLIFYPRFETTRSVPIADLVAPAPFVLALLALRRLPATTWLAVLCLLAAVHLLTIQGAVLVYTTTVFEAGQHSRAVVELCNLFYLLFYQPLRFAQVPLALLYIHSSPTENAS